MQLPRTYKPIALLSSFFAGQWERSIRGWFNTSSFHHCSRWDCSSAAARLSSSHQRASAAWEETESFSLAPQLQRRPTPWWIRTVCFTRNINCPCSFICTSSAAPLSCLLSPLLATGYTGFSIVSHLQFIRLYNDLIHESVHFHQLRQQHATISIKD